jgi:hypothetical protein
MPISKNKRVTQATTRRGTCECPPLLDEVFSVLRLLPGMSALEADFRDLLATSVSEADTPYAVVTGNDPEQWIIHTPPASKFLPLLSTEAQTFFAGEVQGLPGPAADRAIAERYFELQSWRAGLVKLGEGYRKWQQTGRAQFRHRLKYDGFISVDATGKLRTDDDLLARAIFAVVEDHPAHVWRVFGVCHREGCTNLFWISREGKEYCSLRCGNAIRANRRPRKPAQYEAVMRTIENFRASHGLNFPNTEEQLQLAADDAGVRVSTVQRALAFEKLR